MPIHRRAPCALLRCLLVAMAIASTACVPGAEPRSLPPGFGFPPHDRVVTERLAYQRELWHRASSGSYSFTYSRGDASSSRDLVPVRISVQDARIVGLEWEGDVARAVREVLARGGFAPDSPAGTEGLSLSREDFSPDLSRFVDSAFPTIESLFRRAETALWSDAGTAHVTWDPELGFPREITRCTGELGRPSFVAVVTELVIQ